jgi:hypothetical protein
MKKASLVIEAPFNNGAVFKRTDSALNRDNCLQFYFFLQDYFLENGIDLNTADINKPQDSEIIIYNEMPKNLLSGLPKQKLNALLFESELILKTNWQTDRHHHFSKIFTWHDGFVDDVQYFKMNFTNNNDPVDFLSFQSKTKFCTLIAGNKTVRHPLELYSERRTAIRWFEKNHPELFEFYGVGWDKYKFDGNRFLRALNRFSIFNPLREALSEKFPSYRGPVKSKLTTLKNYKFSICYENARDIPGYITEKIFDSLAAGCIPIYWGAPNISDYIPNDCFIDRKQFSTYEVLFEYMQSMSETEYNSRLESVRKFLQGKDSEKFSPWYNARFVGSHILNKV